MIARTNNHSVSWWNKESEILNSHLKCFSLEKHIGVRRKEATVNHATSYEILCEKQNPRIEVKIFPTLKVPLVKR